MTKRKTIAETPALPPRDLSRITSINWPNNPRSVVATQYVALRDLQLQQGQQGFFVTTPEGFVFERVDIHAITPCDAVSISLVGDDGQLLAAVDIDGNQVKAVKLSGQHKVSSGEYYAAKSVLIENRGETMPRTLNGKIAITFLGYRIEPWR